jgi:hypothetical protein
MLALMYILDVDKKREDKRRLSLSDCGAAVGVLFDCEFFALVDSESGERAKSTSQNSVILRLKISETLYRKCYRLNFMLQLTQRARR